MPGIMARPVHAIFWLEGVPSTPENAHAQARRRLEMGHPPVVWWHEREARTLETPAVWTTVVGAVSVFVKFDKIRLILIFSGL